MAKKKPRKENSKKDREREPLLAPETRDSIVAIVALVAAVLSIMAWIGVAGRVGEWAYALFSLLLGRGYFLLPVALSLVAAALLFSLKQKFVSLPLIGAGLFLISSLALADIGFGERTGGLIGEYTAKQIGRAHV